MRDIVLIAGPNGAGKSTFARLLLPEAMPFLNADEIAKALPEEERGRDVGAGRELFRRMETLTAQGRSFAVETTLATRALAARIARLQAAGYRFHLLFIRAPSPELSIARVACRVRRGGHDIPEATIRRRFATGLAHFEALYRPMADHWQVFENSVLAGPVRLESGIVRSPDTLSLFDDASEVLRRFQVAVQEALRDHALAGNPVAVWDGGIAVVVTLPVP